MKRYVITIALSPEGKTLVLGKLRGPKQVVGRFSFPGGHIEDNESIEEAACRELLEESGVAVTQNQLRAVAIKEREGEFVLYVFVAYLNKGQLIEEATDGLACSSEAHTLTDEPIYVVPAADVLADAATRPFAYGESVLTFLALALDAQYRSNTFVEIPL